MKILIKNPKRRMRSVVPSVTHNVNAIFKQLLMMILGLISFENQGFAQSALHSDFKLGLNGRTYPIGAQIAASGGLAYSFWGDTKTWKYGYARAGLNLMTSAVVNRAGIELQVFPISIFGISAGYDTGTRNFIPKWLDCNLYECTGRVDRKHMRAALVAAYSGFSFMFIARYEELRGFNSTSKLVFDETTLVLAKRDGESVFTMNPVLLYQVGERTNVGLVSLYTRALNTGGYSHLYGPIVSHSTSPKFNILAGIGLNTSPVVHSGLCGFFQLQYNIKPSLSVMDLALRNSQQNPALDVSESPVQ